MKRAFAIAAHPDDIEFMMAGTFLLLGAAGYELHAMTLANGCCGGADHDAPSLAQIRRREAMASAAVAGATYHASLVNDLEILYDRPTLTRLGSIVREVAPEIILTHAPAEYMEDHTTTTRLVLTAAFARGMRNFEVIPPRPPVNQPVTVYHALPYGLRDPLRRRVQPGIFVDITSVMSTKAAMLKQHVSQQAWLDSSQGQSSLVIAMEEMAREVGKQSGRFEHAEGWTRHLHLGYGDPDDNPLVAALGPRALVSQEFESSLR